VTAHHATGEPDGRRGLTYLLPSPGGAVWLGLGPAALTGLAVTTSCTVLLLLTGAPLLFATAVTAAGAALSCLRLAGRTVLQWTPRAGSHLRAHACGAARWTLPLPKLTAPGSAAPVTLSLLPESGPVRLTTAASPKGQEELAVLSNQGGTRTVVLDIVGTGRFGLLDPHEQDGHIAGWGNNLAALLAAPGLLAATWLTHTRPHPAPCARSRAALTHNGTGSSDELAVDYLRLEQNATAQAVRHQHLLALTFTKTAKRPPVSDDGDLLEQARQVATRLLADDLLARPLSPADVAALLAQMFDPSRDDLDNHTTVHTAALVGSRRNDWTFCTTDDTVHRSFAITGWPRTALSADWLTPLLLHPTAGGSAHTFAVQARPVATEHAARRARAASARARLDNADRQRLGFTPAAHSHLDQLDADATEAELVAGYRMADVAALMTLHAPTVAVLDAATRDLRALDVTLRLDLRPLHGQHAIALAATLPTGIVPGTRR
jgi:hypothetical protein